MIADANSMTYLLHKRLEMTLIDRGGRSPAALLAASADSVRKAAVDVGIRSCSLSGQEGYHSCGRFAVGIGTRITAASNTGRDLGADVSPRQSVSPIHRFENTYISTFQTFAVWPSRGDYRLAQYCCANVLSGAASWRCSGLGIAGAPFAMS